MFDESQGLDVRLLLMMRRANAQVMQCSFGASRRTWYCAQAMGQARFLTSVHEKVRESARSGQIIDAYRLADDLMAEDLSYSITRARAVNTVIAAGVVYGASLLLDPYRASANDSGYPAQIGTQRERDLDTIRNAFA